MAFSDNITVDNCEFIDNYVQGVNLGGSEKGYESLAYHGVKNFSVTNCNVSGTSGKGINVFSGTYSSDGGIVSNNTVTNVGLFKNIGLDVFATATGGGVGIHCSGNTFTISNNTINTIGYAGLVFKKKNNWIY